MSWTRFGSKCTGTIVPHPANDVCPPDTCPGSDVYVYHHVDGGFACCMCRLLEDPLGEFRVDTEDEMIAHLHEHVAAGHHVRPSILIASPGT